MHCRSDRLQMHRTSELSWRTFPVSEMSSVIFAMNFPFLCGLIVVRTPGISRVLTTFAPHQGTDTPPHSGDEGHNIHPDHGQVLDGDLLDITIPFGIFSLSLTSLDCHRRKFIVWTGCYLPFVLWGKISRIPFYSPAYALCLEKKQERNKMIGTSTGEQTFQK